MSHLKKLIYIILFCPILLFGQAYDPAVSNLQISPTPLEYPGTGQISLDISNEGNQDILSNPGDPIEIRINLSFIEIDFTTVFTDALSGTAVSLFTWQYFDALGILYGTQAQTISANTSYNLTVDVQATQYMPINNPGLVGFTANIFPSFGVLIDNDPTNDNGSLFTRSTCDLPNISVGEITCDSTSSTYTVSYISNATTITASAGTIDTANNIITDIPFGTNVTINVENDLTCSSSITVNAITAITCSTTCVRPDLVVGQPICDSVGGNTFTVSYTETTGATINPTGGTIDSATNTISGTIGTDIQITANNGLCITTIVIPSPVHCDYECEVPPISIGGKTCASDGSATYEVEYSTAPGATVSSNLGTVDTVNSKIIDVPSGMEVTITVSLGTCDDTVIIVPAADCCSLPILTAGDIVCNDLTGEYSVSYFTNGLSVSSTAGTVNMSSNIITNVPVGTDITISSTNGSGCETTIDVVGPDSCPTDCAFSDLEVGNAVCDSEGGSTYTIAYTETTGAIITTNGTNNGNGTISANIGTDLTVTATNGLCIIEFIIPSPDDCNDPCENPIISIGGATCASDTSATYDVSFSILTGASISFTTADSSGTLSGNSITGITSGVDVTITASFTGCDDTVITVPGITCPDCVPPTLTVGPAYCDSTTSTYTVSFVSNNVVNVNGGVTLNANPGGLSGTATASLGTDIIFTSSSSAGCDTIITATEPDTCPTDCVLPDLTISNGICDGINATTYTSIYSLTNSTNISVNTADGVTIDTVSQTITAPVGTNIIATSNNGSCVTTFEVTSPTDCSDPCSNPLLAIAGTICDSGGGATYDVSFNLFPGATVSFTTADSSGTLSGNSITGITSGVDITITASFTGCDDTVITVPGITCPDCVPPTLTVGPAYCDSTTSTYTVSFVSNNVVNVNGGVTLNANPGGLSGTATAPLGTDIIFTSSSSAGCDTIITATEPDTCPTDCVLPDLTISNGICDGINATTYTSIYSLTNSTNISVNTADGVTIDTVSQTITAPVGTNIIATSNNGSCVTTFEVTSPTDCSDPCSNPLLAIAGTICDSGGGATYDVSFNLFPGATVSFTTADSSGTLSGNSITGITSGVDITITASFTGCDDTVITVPGITCPDCVPPTLTVGPAYCDSTTSTYTVSFVSNNVVNVNGGVTLNANPGGLSGTATAPLGTDIIFTSSSSAGCDTIITATEPDTCPTDCVLPDLTISNGICDGINATTYTSIYSLTNSTNISVNTADGVTIDTVSQTITAPVGTNIIATSNNGSCVTTFEVTSPTDCSDPCSNPLLAIAGTICDSGGGATYDVSFNLFPGATVSFVTADSSGTLSGNTIAGITSGVDVTITASFTGCDDTVITVPAAECTDLGIVFAISDGLVLNGTDTETFYIRIRELLGSDTNDGIDIEVRIFKSANYTLTYDNTWTTATINGIPRAVNNSDWEYDGSDPSVHIFKNRGVILANTESRFAFDTAFDALNTDGQLIISAFIVNGSGGEKEVRNNFDFEPIDYFRGF